MVNAAFMGGFGEGMRQRVQERQTDRRLGMDLFNMAAKQVDGIGDTISDLISNSSDASSVPQQTITALARTADEIINGTADFDPNMANAMRTSLQARIQSARPMAERAASEAQAKVGSAQALVDAAAGASPEAKRILGLIPETEKDQFVQRARAAGMTDEEITAALRQWVEKQTAPAQGPSTKEQIVAQIAEEGIGSLTDSQREALEVMARMDPMFALMLRQPELFSGSTPPAGPQASTPPAPQAQPVPATPSPDNPSPPVTAPQAQPSLGQSGEVPVFNSPEEVEAALRAGQVKIGDIVIVGGQQVRIDP